MEAMVLAAGRGDRLRPVTDTTPKPLIRVGGRTLIEHHLHNLAEQGFDHVVINVSHLAEKIMDYLGDGRRYGIRITYSPEPEGALETAGGIIKALPLFTADRFLVINGDVLTNYQLNSIELGSDVLSTIVLVPNPAHNPDGDFRLDGNHVLTLDSRRGNSYTFSGIGLYRREMFSGLPAGKMRLGEVLNNAIQNGKVMGELHQSLWVDVGTTERLDIARKVIK